MLLKSQRNQFFQVLADKGLQSTALVETVGDNWYRLELTKPNENLWFEVRQKRQDENGRNYIISRVPGYSNSLDKLAITAEDCWENGHYGVLPDFNTWAEAVRREVEAPDLWLESAKTLQFFASANTPVASRFTLAELGAVQGQLRMLGQSFSTSELPDAAKQKLAEIAQTAVLRTETLTKKDWQYWIQGAFSSTVTSLELTEAQIQEVVALVRLAFGGLFLQA